MFWRSPGWSHPRRGRGIDSSLSETRNGSRIGRIIQNDPDGGGVPIARLAAAAAVLAADCAVLAEAGLGCTDNLYHDRITYHTMPRFACNGAEPLKIVHVSTRFTLIDNRIFPTVNTQSSQHFVFWEV